MNLKYYGRIRYANSKAAPGVSVCIFDKDEPGKGDDDLTVKAGLSDQNGQFVVTYSPSRYLDTHAIQEGNRLNPLFNLIGDSSTVHLPDMSDEYQPYLQMSYTSAGQPKVYTLPFSPFRNDIYLDEIMPLDFVPTKHGFRFANSFPGSLLPFHIPLLPQVNKVSQVYGLCGGMASAAYDCYLAGREIPDSNTLTKVPPPNKGTKIHRYLFRRLIDSFSFGVPIYKLARWMTMPNEGSEGIWKTTYDEFEFGEEGGKTQSIRGRLDAQQAVQLALVYKKADTGEEVFQRIWDNHQVLATGYQDLPGGDVEIRIYDPNYPLRDDVAIYAQKVVVSSQASPQGIPAQVFGYKSIERKGSQDVRQVHGFFPMPYSPIEPSL